MDQARQRLALMDALDRVLDKGVVIDAGIRLAVIGIDLVTVDAKITVASVQTYLHLAEDQRAYDLGLIGGSPPRSTTEELERLTEPKRLGGGGDGMGMSASRAAEAAPRRDPDLPIAAYHDEELTKDASEGTDPPEQT